MFDRWQWWQGGNGDGSPGQIIKLYIHLLNKRGITGQGNAFFLFAVGVCRGDGSSGSGFILILLVRYLSIGTLLEQRSSLFICAFYCIILFLVAGYKLKVTEVF
jgi:hypothetical protein